MGPSSESKIFEKTDGNQRLVELGVPVEVLIQTAKDIATSRGNADEFHPVQAGGLLGWIAGVRTFRLGHANVGFSVSDVRGFSSVISPDRKLEAFIMSATKGVGRVTQGKAPRSKAPRGEQTLRRIEANQLSFPLEHLLVEEPSVESLPTEKRENWCFLYQVGKKAIFSEFSKPTAVDENGFVIGWAERIILDPIAIASDIVHVAQDAETPNIDVEVKMKNNGA
jgi:hypothetical protein